MRHTFVKFDDDYNEDDYYNDWYEYSNEGDELPYFLEHITTEKLYKEFIKDTSDDEIIKIANRRFKGGGCAADESKTTARNIQYYKHK